MLAEILLDPCENIAAHAITLEVRLDSNSMSRLSSRISSVENLRPMTVTSHRYLHTFKCHD